MDIETVPLDDPVPAYVKRLKEKYEDDWEDQLSFQAPTARVVCVSCVNYRTNGHFTIFDNSLGGKDTNDQRGGDEKKLLEEWWELVKKANQIVTYGGRKFDIPFLVQRSMVHGVTITKDLMPPRFSRPSVHVDLLDILSEYRATQPFGLETWCQMLGIESPKEGDVVGATVAKAFHEGRIQEVIEYCLRDVRGTAEVFRRLIKTTGTTRKYIWS